jgi:hypothetical protein
MMLHVEHVQEMQKGKAWCGEDVIGPRISGVENFMYHAADPNAGQVCERCISAVLDRIGDAIRKTQSLSQAKGGSPC